MSLPEPKRQTIEVAGVGEVTVREMSAACYVEMLDLRAAERSEVEVSAAIAKHCVEEWRDSSTQEIMDTLPPAALIDVMTSVINFTGLKSGKSAADRVAASSSS